MVEERVGCVDDANVVAGSDSQLFRLRRLHTRLSQSWPFPYLLVLLIPLSGVFSLRILLYNTAIIDNLLPRYILVAAQAGPLLADNGLTPTRQTSIGRLVSTKK